jgi:hypothetical protein
MSLQHEHREPLLCYVNLPGVTPPDTRRMDAFIALRKADESVSTKFLD